MSTLLIALPGRLTSQHLASGNQATTSGFEVELWNREGSLVKLTNIKLTLEFDFSSQNLTINGLSKSTPGSSEAVVIDIDEELLPGFRTLVTLAIKANVGGTPSAATQYPLKVLATYDTEPLPEIGEIVEPVKITGGDLLFVVVPT